MLARMTDSGPAEPGPAERGTHQSLPDPRNENVLVWIDGQLVPRDQAKVSVFDSAFLVGDGVWEGLRLVNGRFAHLGRHLDRLFQGAAAIGLSIGRTRDELHQALRETVDANDMHDGVHARLMVSRGTKKTPSQDPRLVVGGPTIVIIAEHKAADPDVTRAGIRLATSATRRPPPDTLDPKLNCHSKLHEVIALVQALRAGADEALMLDPHGFVATCNATNFFVVRRGEVWTSTGRYCMNGITRALVLEIARDLGSACARARHVAHGGVRRRRGVRDRHLRGTDAGGRSGRPRDRRRRGARSDHRAARRPLRRADGGRGRRVTGDPLDLRIDPAVTGARGRKGPPARRLSIWSGPRNVSTALMYAFRQRGDTIVFDEPLYAHYLSVAKVDHPGQRAVLDEMDTVGERVVDRVLLGGAPPAGPGSLGYRQRRDDRARSPPGRTCACTRTWPTT